METYIPEIETARKAPAIICAVASRTLRLRKQVEILNQKQDKEPLNERGQRVLKLSLREIESILNDYISPLPFEKELLSSSILKVDEAIRNFS